MTKNQINFEVIKIIQLWTYFWTFLLKPPQPLMGLFFYFQTDNTHQDKLKNIICLTSVTRAKPKEKNEICRSISTCAVKGGGVFLYFNTVFNMVFNTPNINIFNTP